MPLIPHPRDAPDSEKSRLELFIPALLVPPAGGSTALFRADWDQVWAMS